MPLKMFRLQPKKRADGVLPYPFFIGRNGRVSRQDFWKGEPFRLEGFNPRPVSGPIDGTIDIADFLETPEKAIGMYPIFSNEDNTWHTYQDPIASIERIV